MSETVQKIKAFFCKRSTRSFLLFLAATVALFFLFVAIVNLAVIGRSAERIYSVDECAALDGEYDCILILGAGVRADGSPTPMLYDRLKTGFLAYDNRVAQTVFLSGDSEADDYRETDAMKKFLTDEGVPEERIVCDGYGLSTYESLWRIKNVYGFDNILIITQEYHLYRALYIAEKLGIEAEGVNASLRGYGKQALYDIRESFARVKDVFFSQSNPTPKYTEKW